MSIYSVTRKISKDFFGKQKIGRRLPVPQDKVVELIRLHDARVRENSENDDLHMAHFNLCSFIYELFPETREGTWDISFPTRVTAEVVELVGFRRS